MTKQRIPGVDFLTVDNATPEFARKFADLRLAADLSGIEP
jgi:hypothetical protein